MLQRVDSQRRELQTITRAGLRRAVYNRIPRLSRAEVGRLVVSEEGKQIDSVPVLTEASVARAGFFKRLGDHFRKVK